MKKHINKDIIPLLISAIIMLISIGIALFSDTILNNKHYIAIGVLGISFLLYFKSQKLYIYFFALTLVLGTVNLIDIFYLEIYFKINSIQFDPLFLTLLILFLSVNKEKLYYLNSQNNLKSDISTSNKMNQKFPTSQIKRKNKLKGTLVSSIINNGGNYFMIDLPVFENGVFYCWEYVGIRALENKISKGWLTPQIPNHEYFSIHHLGSWKIKNAYWKYDKKNYANYLISLVKEMNPEMQNLCHSHDISSIDYSSFAYSSNELLKESAKKPNLKESHGKREHYFFKQTDGIYYLASVNIYNDSTIFIEGIPNNIICDITKIKDLAKEKTLVTELPVNSTVHVKNLGSFVIAETRFNSNIDDKISELDDILAKLNKQVTSSDICYELFQEYNENPSEELKESLKIAYEKIPKHLRVYILGDMDAKDWPIRQIIYGSEK